MCRQECKSSCLLLQLQSADYLERWPATLNEAGLSVSVVMQRSTIATVELHTFHLHQHYLQFMHNKLLYTWDYCESVQPAQLPVLTLGSSSIPPGTTSTIRSPAKLRRVQQKHELPVSKIHCGFTFWVNQFVNRGCLIWFTMQQFCWTSCQQYKYAILLC